MDKKKVESNYEAIESGEIVVLMEDEIHLCHGDISGYVWGKRNEAIEVKMTNQRDRQSYYGVLNSLIGRIDVQEQPYGNGQCTVAFLKELPKWYPNAKQFWILWDNASYHRSKEVKDYLAIVNKDLPENEWFITCIGFATNAPEQNPIEDVWLKGKNFIRKNFAIIDTFKQAKQAFLSFYDDLNVYFNKFKWYGFK
ncbi:MAG: transposase [Bacteroidia bacterium]